LEQQFHWHSSAFRLRDAVLFMVARAVPVSRRLASGYERRVSGNRANVSLLLLHRIPSTRPGIKKSGGWKRNDRAWPERAITHDAAYETVAQDDFAAMLAVERYGGRSNAFDAIIGATHDHFWDPHNPAYLDYTQPFDLERDSLMPLERFPELNCAATAHLDCYQKIRLANEVQRWNLSNILHGEQGALSLSASLCDILLDPGAQEYAANQAREEARHVAAFGRYIAVRWGTPYPVGQLLGDFLSDIVRTPLVYKKAIIYLTKQTLHFVGHTA
jgi:hypothetical protein